MDSPVNTKIAFPLGLLLVRPLISRTIDAQNTVALFGLA